MDLWIASRPDYAPLLIETRRARAAFVAKALRDAARLVRMGAAKLREAAYTGMMGMYRGLRRWRRRTVTQRELHRLSDHSLHDIGLPRDGIGSVAHDLALRQDADRKSRKQVRAARQGRAKGAEAEAQLAHNLRTPLTAIRSLSEIVRDNPGLALTQRQRFLGQIVHESDRLNHAIDRVLKDRKAA